MFLHILIFLSTKTSVLDSVLNFPGDTFQPFSSYIFSVTVSHVDKKNSTASQIIDFIPDATPILRIR